MAVMAVLVIGFAFTTGPYYLYHWLGTGLGDYRFRPDYIIVPGSSGYPGEAVLMRAWYAAQLQEKYPASTIILSHPLGPGVQTNDPEAVAVRNELIMRGADSTRIRMVTDARNTREEAVIIVHRFPELQKRNCVIVTSPEHMRRAILSFRKEGVERLGGLPAFEQTISVSLAMDELGPTGRRQTVPVIGRSLQLRYQFWNHLKYQLLCYRELVAILWYQVMGWI